MSEVVVEACPVRQARQAVVQRHIAELLDRIPPHTVIDEIAGKPCTDDNQRDRGDGKCQRLQGGGSEKAPSTSIGETRKAVIPVKCGLTIASTSTPVAMNLSPQKARRNAKCSARAVNATDRMTDATR